MLKISVVFASALLICTAQTSAAKTTAQKRSFAECQKLALECGVRMPKMPQRYTELGTKARKPTGFMAQCMAGKIA